MSGSSDNRRWLEGTAVYFSNVVYPDFNRGWSKSEYFEPAESLLDHVYATNFFFQDLANRTGKEGIISLIASIPHENGQAAQQNALAGFPDLQRHWHQFGRDYLDNNMHDTGLLTVDVKPQPGERVSIESDFHSSATMNGVPMELGPWPRSIRHRIQHSRTSRNTNAARLS